MPSAYESRVEDFILSARRQRDIGDKGAVRQMETPRVGQQVQIEGHRDQIYVVLRVDEARHLADLLMLGPVRKVETGVSLTALRLVAGAGHGDLKRARG